MNNRLAGALVFLTAGSVLVLEILAGRMLAPYVGVSLNTFTGIIGVVLAGIATGTWIGGRLADQYEPRRLLPVAVAGGGALAIAAVPLIHGLGGAGIAPGPSLILFLAGAGFFLPSAVLSMVAPLVVKLQLDALDHTGRVVGWLSAMGTCGSIVGVFVTGFVLIAAFPTTPVVLALGGLLVVIGAALWFHLGRRSPRLLIVACSALAVVSAGASVLAGGRCEFETAYFCGRVDTDPSRPTGRTLWLDTLRHSYVDLADPTHLEFAYARVFGDVIDHLAPTGAPLDVVNVGGGGFTIPRYIAATRPGSANLVLELDPTIVEVAEDQLGLERSADLVVETGDGRIALAALDDNRADLVIGDAFGGRAVPWHLTTREFAADVRRVLRDDGTYLVNLIDRPPTGFAKAELVTLSEVFAHVAVIASPRQLAGEFGGNFVVVASDQDLPLDAVAIAIAARGDDDEIIATGPELDELVGGADVLTDEHAPVDQLLGS